MGLGGMVERPAEAGKGLGRGLGAPGAAGAPEGWGGLDGSGNLGRPVLRRGERAWEAPGWDVLEGPRGPGGEMPAGLGGPGVWAFWEGWEARGLRGRGAACWRQLGQLGRPGGTPLSSPAFGMEDWIPGLSGGEGAGEA